MVTRAHTGGFAVPMVMRLELALLLLVAGCDALVDADYRGEPSGRLQGVLRGEPSPRNPPIELGIGWTVFDGDGLLVDYEFEMTPTDVEFGGHFSLPLYPPPDHLIGRPRPDRGFRAEGFVTAVHRATAEAAVEDQLIGYNGSYKLIYLPEDVEPDSLTATMLCGALSAGFHLMEINASGTPRPPECGADWEAADGLDTLIEVELF